MEGNVKMYILDENGRVVLEFSKEKGKESGKLTIAATDDVKIRLTDVIRAAFMFVSYSIGRK
jgi:hypothetical protein